MKKIVLLFSKIFVQNYEEAFYLKKCIKFMIFIIDSIL